MLLADAEKARLMDYNSINKYNIPSALLMEKDKEKNRNYG